MRKKKKALTLLEIIIVIFLITLITGAIGYSMKGSLDKGRVFKTQTAMQQLRDLFLMAVAEGQSGEEIAKSPKEALKNLGLAKDPDKLVVDGWGTPFEITYNKRKNDFTIVSKEFNAYQAKKKIEIPTIDDEE